MNHPILWLEIDLELLNWNFYNFWVLIAMLRNQWSVYLTYTSMIQVKIPLKSTILILYELLGKNENKRKWGREWHNRKLWNVGSKNYYFKKLILHDLVHIHVQAERAKHSHRQAPDVRQPSQHRPVPRLQGRHRQGRKHPGQHHRWATVLQVRLPLSFNNSSQFR